MRKECPQLRVVIIGNGIAGITAAITLRGLKPDWGITVISGESDYFFSRPALMYIYMGHLRFQDTKPYEDRFWDRKQIERIRGWVTTVDTKKGEVILDGRSSVFYDKLLIATGSQSNKFGWPGQDLSRVHGFYSLQDLSTLERDTAGLRRTVIVGGGLIGIELAEMLHSRGAAVTMLVREDSYWNNVMPNGESAMINELIREQGIDLRLGTELKEIVNDGHGNACAVVTGDGEEIECQLVGLTAGIRPNLSALEGSNIPTGRGVLVDERMCTEVAGVYAAGDCAEVVNKEDEHRVWQVWYTGKAQGVVAARVMAGEEGRYDPGIWFNSAKFLDLEWQTYGKVTCGMDEGKGEMPPCLYWEHPDRRHSLRLALCDGTITGVNTMGIRYRHRVCERWIAEKRTVDYVLDHLREANFDPEFFSRHEPQIVGVLKEQLS
jgi:NADPH-dependent 2,4-dienoyl-CoA reductase/sulfur reductase-like enzyme